MQENGWSDAAIEEHKLAVDDMKAKAIAEQLRKQEERRKKRAGEKPKG